MADPVAIAGLSLGAVNAVAGVLFGAYKLLIDRARLRVAFSTGFVTQGASMHPNQMLIIEVSNTGRRHKTRIPDFVRHKVRMELGEQGVF